MKKVSTKNILDKKSKEKIVMITAYDAIFASLADKANADILLVGDSVGNTFLGMESTIPVTIDDIAHHTKAVARADPSAMIIADIPFALPAYSFDKLLKKCIYLMQECKADGVKIECGKNFAPIVQKLTDAGIPVIAHIGLLPQQYLKLGQYRSFGNAESEAQSLITEALALQEAGAFCVLMEMVNAKIAKEITEKLSIPTIGIGSGADCDGQVLVCTDILGLSQKVPPFAKKYANLSETIFDAFENYADDVRSEKFPK